EGGVTLQGLGFELEFLLPARQVRLQGHLRHVVRNLPHCAANDEFGLDQPQWHGLALTEGGEACFAHLLEAWHRKIAQRGERFGEPCRLDNRRRRRRAAV